MSIIGLVEGAATAGSPWGWLRIAAKLLPYVVIAGLAAALIITRGTLDHVRMQARLDVAAGKLDSAKHDLEQAGRANAAVTTYADKAAALQPIVVRSTDTVTRYAETPAGRAPCAAPDRVLGIDQLDATLWPPVTTAGRASGVHPDAGAAPAGRVGEQRR